MCIFSRKYTIRSNKKKKKNKRVSIFRLSINCLIEFMLLLGDVIFFCFFLFFLFNFELIYFVGNIFRNILKKSWCKFFCFVYLLNLWIFTNNAIVYTRKINFLNCYRFQFCLEKRLFYVIDFFLKPKVNIKILKLE